MSMNERTLKNAAPPPITVALQSLAAKAFVRSAALRRRVRNAGEVADFIDWQMSQFGRATVYRTRERLWSALNVHMDSERSWHGLEFGVAWGYATGWWLNKLPETPGSTWDGFDRFTGLPRAWREHEKGTFDVGGIPPSINDSRLTWHIGDVEETAKEFDHTAVAGGGRLILFDLDIYEPTVTAWNLVQPLLQPGDLLYFDEAMDADERRVLTELVLPSHEFKYVGCTSLALALLVER